MLDDMHKTELDRLVRFIGNGVRPVKEATAMFPDKPKGYLRTVKDVRNYAWNKIVALNPELTRETRAEYARIAGTIWADLPLYARAFDYKAFLQTQEVL